MMRYLQIKSYENWQEIQDAVFSYAHEGLRLMTYLVAITILLELLSFRTARALYKKNQTLYMQAWMFNFVNHYVLAIPGYIMLRLWLVQDDDKATSEDVVVTTTVAATAATSIKILQILWQVLRITIVHSLGFYQVHKTFHSHPQLYKYHKFHHSFNTLVPPVSAAAVSPVEYMTAYLFPFLLAVLLFPSIQARAFSVSVLFMGFFNVVMHCPPLEHYYDAFAPDWIVGTGDHLEHHKRLQCHYAAPTLDIDYFVHTVQSSFVSNFLLPGASPHGGGFVKLEQDS